MRMGWMGWLAVILLSACTGQSTKQSELPYCERFEREEARIACYFDAFEQDLRVQLGNKVRVDDNGPIVVNLSAEGMPLGVVGPASKALLQALNQAAPFSMPPQAELYQRYFARIRLSIQD